MPDFYLSAMSLADLRDLQKSVAKAKAAAKGKAFDEKAATVAAEAAAEFTVSRIVRGWREFLNEIWD